MYGPPLLVRRMIINMKCKLFRKDEKLIQRGDTVDHIYFLHFGCARLYGYLERPGQDTIRFKVMTLKKGSWFGDYNIMLNLPSNWDLVGGGDNERSNKKKPIGLPLDNIMVYTLEASFLRDILNEYPTFRAFIVNRSVLRKQYFLKTFE